MAPPSLAYAAAADMSNNPSSASRTGNGDRSRRPNGATQTFRRSSAATSSATSNAARDSSHEQASAKYMPPYRNSNSISSPAPTTVSGEMRYSKSDLLNAFKSCQDAQDFQIDSLSDLFIGGWDPYINESSSRQRRDESGRPEKMGTDICWDEAGFEIPLAAVPMDEEEKSLFFGSVNSVLKHAASRDSSIRDQTHRHNSTSNTARGFASTNNSGPSSSGARTSGRRHETTESQTYNIVKDEQDNPDVDTPWKARPSDASDSRLRKDSTSTGLADTPSTWGGTGLSNALDGSAMGAFGLLGSAAIGTPGEKRPGMPVGRAESRFKGLMSRDPNQDEQPPQTSTIAQSTSFWRAQGTLDDDELPQGPSARIGGGDSSQSARIGQSMPDDSHDIHQMPKSREDHGRSDHVPPFNSAMSPTNTDPHDRPSMEHDTNGHGRMAHLPGLGPMSGNLAGLQGPTPSAAFGQHPDRSQNSSVNQQRPFGGFSGLGGLAGLGSNSPWGSTHGTAASSVRERAGLGGDGSFGSSADLQSSGLAGLGPSGFYSAPNQIGPASVRTSSRLGALFSNRSSQDVQRLTEDQRPLSDSRDEDDLSGFARDSNHQAFSQIDMQHDFDREQFQGSGEAGSDHASSSSIPPSTAQQKTMVMPDRMRWIYRDPQGNTQGPWSGLEMHDWYKAGFFSPELQVKKYEDTEYEPLAQLIRRIGNSREPFLVPQIGIPHGTAAPPGWNAGPTTATGPQPPFANNFPSFGTTLTADQQNALERRKQEEQYLMARQKEHLAQQQLAQRLQIHGQHQLLPHQVPHPQLHIQPGMPSATGAYQPSPMSASGKQGFYDAGIPSRGAFGGHGGVRDQFGHGLEEDMFHRYNDRLGGAGLPEQHPGPPGGHLTHAQQVKAMSDDRERLQQEQTHFDQQQQQQQQQQLYSHEAAAASERLQEFKALSGMSEDLTDQPVAGKQAQSSQISGSEQPSLTEQVQQAVSAQQSPATQSPWAKIKPAVSQTAPPASPLPAPAAQRNRQHVADSLNAGSRSRSQTGSLDATNAPLAPWAKEPTEASRGPSLKEIQEAEAKTAAKAEALAAEARRTAMERELLLQAQAAAAAASAVGLPSSSTWAKEPTVSATSSPTPWAKATKPAASTPTAKSMAQIQKEEEARKKRLAAAALAAQQQAATANGATVAGKRYAELASKGTPNIPTPPTQGGGGSWTTVAAGGKAKTPAPVTAPVRPTAVSASSAKRVVSVGRPVSTPSASSNAREEVTKWAISVLKDDLAGVSAEDLVRGLDELPAESALVTEAVHPFTKTTHSSRFAEQYVSLRKMADKGVFDPSRIGATASSIRSGGVENDDGKNAGGWSEVAKKGARDPVVKEDDVAGANFKVVAGKKKGGRR